MTDSDVVWTALTCQCDEPEVVVARLEYQNAWRDVLTVWNCARCGKSVPPRSADPA